MPDVLRPIVAEVVCPLSPCLSYTRRNSTAASSRNSKTQTFPAKSHFVESNDNSVWKKSRRYDFNFNGPIMLPSPRFLVGSRLFRSSKRSLRHFFHRKEFRRKGNESKRESVADDDWKDRRDVALTFVTYESHAVRE